METELAWRQEEIAFIKNQLANINNEVQKDKYRKCLVLVLYSHFEGFVKISLLTYIEYINSLGLIREDVNANLAVTSMSREFNAYDNNDMKGEVFKKTLPEDRKIHRYFRRVHLLEELNVFEKKELAIPDEAIDTESNLWYVVLQKNLYKVGLPIELFSQSKKDIDALVNRRNSIAHGSEKSGIKKEEYELWEKKIYRVMEDMIKIIYDCTVQEKYLKV